MIEVTEKDPGGCIVIAADFVTLDLAGNTIIGPGAGVGIFSVGRGVKVHSGAVTNFEFGVLLNGNGYTVEHVRAINNLVAGIDISGGTGHRVVGNVAHENGVTGIGVRCPSVVLDNVAKGNPADIVAVGDCTRLGNSPLP